MKVKEKKNKSTNLDLQNLDTNQLLFYLLQKMDHLSGDIKDLDTRLSNKIEELDTRLSNKIGELDTRLSNKIGDLDTRLSNKIDSNFKWVLGITITGFLAIMLGFVHLHLA